MRILLVEDEPHIAEAVASHLAAHAQTVDHVTRLDEADAALAVVDFDLMLLDLHLPDGRGLDLLKKIRAGGSALPVIIVTARDQISDRIAGLNAGADDYLVKPFDLAELQARIAAVARRHAGNPSPVRTLGSLEVDGVGHTLKKEGKDIPLTRREWALLELLARRPGALVTKRQMEEAIYDFDQEIESNSVEVHVSRLRKKIGHECIVTLRGIGYRLAVS